MLASTNSTENTIYSWRHYAQKKPCQRLVVYYFNLREIIVATSTLWIGVQYRRNWLLSAYFLLSAQFCASFTALCQAHMPSKPAERRAIGYSYEPRKKAESRLEKKRRELRSLASGRSLPGHRCRPIYPQHVLYARPTYRVLALLIKRMLPVKRILFIKRIFSCCRVL